MGERREWLKAYVEELLRGLGDDEAVCEFDDGGFFLRWDTAAVQTLLASSMDDDTLAQEVGHGWVVSAGGRGRPGAR
jgi:hypothetical protein